MSEQCDDEQALMECAALGLHPHPIGESNHHSEYAMTETDKLIGNSIAWFMGDLFTGPKDAPNLQWAKVARALRIHGLAIRDAR